MIARASRKFIRMTPRKLRLVADSVRAKDAETALTLLKFTQRRAAEPLATVMKQAIANARQLGMSSPLRIVRLEIGEGPVYKRWQAVSRGQAHPLVKYTSHIWIELETTAQKSHTAAAVASKTRTARAEKPADKQTETKETVKELAPKAETKQAKKPAVKPAKESKKVTTSKKNSK